MTNTLVVFIVLFFSLCNVAFSQNSYVREGSIGKQKDQADSADSQGFFSFRPVEKWVGEKFIFLPKPKSLQEYGYQNFENSSGGLNNSDSSAPIGLYGHPSYKECVGRIGTIVSASDREITIRMDDNEQSYQGRVSLDSVSGIAPLADIDNARAKFLGSTLWYSKEEITTYDNEAEKYGRVKIRKYSPVKIIDIIAGWYDHEPIRFILQTPTGEEGFQDVNLSGTNVSSILRDSNRFDDYFLTKDPRKTYKWVKKVWAAVEEGKVFIGMTAEQARMSWGKPEEVNRTITGNVKHEQWIYGESYLYFENGILSGIQN